MYWIKCIPRATVYSLSSLLVCIWVDVSEKYGTPRRSYCERQGSRWFSSWQRATAASAPSQELAESSIAVQAVSLCAIQVLFTILLLCTRIGSWVYLR